jgi:hypothetical protein
MAGPRHGETRTKARLIMPAKMQVHLRAAMTSERGRESFRSREPRYSHIPSHGARAR